MDTTGQPTVARKGPWGHSLASGLENAGKAWTTDAENQLIKMLFEGASVETCAATFKRTPGGIRSRQIDIAYRYTIEGKTVKEACKIMKIDEDLLNKSISLRNIATEAKANKKKPQTQLTFGQIVPAVQEETQLSVLKEIRDLLKDVLTKI